MNKQRINILIQLFKKLLKRNLDKAKWEYLRNLQPISKVFGLDRGQAIDRYYIENFLIENSNYIHGTVMEIAEKTYSKKFGKNVTQYEILHFNQCPEATIVGDLTKIETLPTNTIDCFICTQTLNFIFDFHLAIKGIYHVLKKGGVALVSLAGLCQISRYDMDRWGDYWRFTSKSAHESFSHVFGKQNIKVKAYGNVLASIALLEGISCEELKKEELDFNDQDYQITIGVVAKKTKNETEFH